ncbi:MAG: tetratricopeptide repeat protein [Planctomycetaceae bacterium]|jgi:Flp pilus assembly protein TadD|nr:tetratricopeptide repeat protein [Planctomycetaceae bacterium]
MTFASILQAAQDAYVDGEHQKSLPLYLRLLQECDGQPIELVAKLWNQVGILQCQLGENYAGIGSFQHAINLLSGVTTENLFLAQVHFNTGLTQRSLGLTQDAIDSLVSAEQLSPDYADALLVLGQLYFEKGHNIHARQCFERLTTLQPNNPSNWLTLGYIMTLNGDYNDALPALNEAERLDPHSVDACFYIAESLRQTGRYEDSLPYYQRLLPVAMERPAAMLGYSETLLSLGRLEEAWDAFEFRRIARFGTWERHLLKNWDGNPSPDKNVLIYGEDGVGTDIMFSSCLSEAIRDVGHCVVECDGSLHKLFARSFPQATIVPQTLTTLGENGETEIEIGGVRVSEQLAIGSLPRYYRRKMTDFPIRSGYLLPDASIVAGWRKRFAAIGRLPKIGFLWQGSGTDEAADLLALPTELVTQLVRNERRASWICLQRGNAQQTFETMRHGLGNVHLFGEAFVYDIDYLAALLASLDLIITPAGHIAHLAGSLGTRTWLLLPNNAAWRWSLAGERTPWHPSVKIFRRAEQESWKTLFERVTNELETFLLRTANENWEEESIIKFPFRQATSRELERAA